MSEAAEQRVMEEMHEATSTRVRVELPQGDDESSRIEYLDVVRPADPARSDPIRAAGMSSGRLAATAFMAWGFEALAERFEAGDELADALLELASSPEAAAAFAAKREQEEGPYEPEMYLHTIGERFYGGGNEHEHR